MPVLNGLKAVERQIILLQSYRDENFLQLLVVVAIPLIPRRCLICSRWVMQMVSKLKPLPNYSRLGQPDSNK